MQQKEVNLIGAKNAMNTTGLINKTLVISLIGFFMLIVGTIMSISLKNPPEIYFGLWVAVSGGVTIAYSIIKLIKDIMIY